MKQDQNLDKKFCILFAGPVGSGKSPIANYLSYKLNLPVFNNDAVRNEVWADMLEMNQEEYQRRKIKRLKEILKSGINFIYDASIDRRWHELKPMLENADYTPIIISLNFSKNRLKEIYKVKNFSSSEILDRTFKDHGQFVANSCADIAINIDDNQFLNRLEVALEAVNDLM